MASPHTFKLEEVDNLARTASALVTKDLVLGATVNKSFSAEFSGKRGASVNVRIPASVTASSRALDTTTTLNLSNISEGTQAIALVNNEYVAVNLSDEDMNLRIEDYAEQIVAPMALAISERIEDRVVAAMTGITETAALDTLLDLSTAENARATAVPTFILARETLRNMGAPDSGLHAAVSTDVYSALLNAQALAGTNGGQGDALANATIGKIAGFKVIESNRLPAKNIVFYHRDAISLVLRAPAVPPSVGWGSSQMVQGGVPVRITRSFDNDALAERAVMNVYSGIGTLTAKLATTGSNVLFALRVADGA